MSDYSFNETRRDDESPFERARHVTIKCQCSIFREGKVESLSLAVELSDNLLEPDYDSFISTSTAKKNTSVDKILKNCFMV